MTGFVGGMALGILGCLIVGGCAGWLYWRRQEAGAATTVRALEAQVVELRQERTEDKELNRRLRHELVTQSPHRLAESAASAEIERDEMVSRLQEAQLEVGNLNARLADREDKLRRYREALHEIRSALEAQDRAKAEELQMGETLPAVGDFGGAGSSALAAESDLPLRAADS